MCRLITGAGSVPAGPSVVCRERCIGVCFLCFRLMSVSVLDNFARSVHLVYPAVCCPPQCAHLRRLLSMVDLPAARLASSS